LLLLLVCSFVVCQLPVVVDGLGVGCSLLLVLLLLRWHVDALLLVCCCCCCCWLLLLLLFCVLIVVVVVKNGRELPQILKSTPGRTTKQSLKLANTRRTNQQMMCWAMRLAPQPVAMNLAVAMM
jgi:hypothetical protein